MEDLVTARTAEGHGVFSQHIACRGDRVCVCVCVCVHMTADSTHQTADRRQQTTNSRPQTADERMGWECGICRDVSNKSCRNQKCCNGVTCDAQDRQSPPTILNDADLNAHRCVLPGALMCVRECV